MRREDRLDDGLRSRTDDQTAIAVPDTEPAS
jgi:hypothetical protein